MRDLLQSTAPPKYDKHISINFRSCRPKVRPHRSGRWGVLLPRVAHPAYERGTLSRATAVQTPTRPSAPSPATTGPPLEIPAPPQLIPLPEAQRWLGVSAETFTRL